jgi:ubiquinone/menaquinone biosynthesis C-methylase UbiE
VPSDYEPSSHWSEVGREIRGRRADSYVAGDVAPYYRYKRQLFLGKLFSRVPVTGKVLLEVGCGPGGNLVELRKRAPQRLEACDISSEMVELARQANPGVKVVQTDAQSLPYVDGEFDTVLTVTVIQHNPDEAATQVMREIARVAKSSVYLFEDTSPPAPSAGIHGNFFGRLVPWYAEQMRGFGYELVESEALSTYFSARSMIALRRLDRGKTTEGSKLSRLHVVVENLSLLLTRQLDRLFPHAGTKKHGFVPPELTMMVFQRKS